MYIYIYNFASACEVGLGKQEPPLPSRLPTLTWRLPRALLVLARLPGGPMPGLRRRLRPSSAPAPPPARRLSSPRQPETVPIPPPPPPPPPCRAGLGRAGLSRAVHRPRHSPAAPGGEEGGSGNGAGGGGGMRALGGCGGGCGEGGRAGGQGERGWGAWREALGPPAEGDAPVWKL